MSNEVPELLQEAANEAHNGHPQTLTLRELLGMFGQGRRSAPVNQKIQRALSDQNLRTEPHFRTAGIDDELTLISLKVEAESEASAEEQEEEREIIGRDLDRESYLYRVSRFVTNATDENMKQKMEQGVTSVDRDAKLEKAATLMMTNNYSQLPVMQGVREPEGLISWESVGRAFALDRQPEHVRDCMEDDVKVVGEDDPIFDLIDTVRTHEVALVQDNEKKIVTLFTAADLADLYKDLSQPFIFLGEIEHRIRGLLESGEFTEEELQEFVNTNEENDDDRTIERMDDLTFGEYERILQNPDNWERIGLPIDRKVFTKRLKEVREIRNSVMHFDPDGLTESQINILEQFSCLLRHMQ